MLSALSARGAREGSKKAEMRARGERGVRAVFAGGGEAAARGVWQVGSRSCKRRLFFNPYFILLIYFRSVFVAFLYFLNSILRGEGDGVMDLVAIFFFSLL